MSRKRFLVKSYGDNVDGTRAGLVKLLQLAGTHRSSVIVVPSLNGVNNTMLVDVLGPQLSAALIKHRRIQLENGNAIELCSHATLKNFRRADAYLALWGSESIVKEIESLPHWTSLVLVTWTPDDAATWVSAHGVEVIYDDGKG